MINEDSNEPQRQDPPLVTAYTVARAILWTGAVIALGFAVYYAWESRWAELGWSSLIAVAFAWADWVVVRIREVSAEMDRNIDTIPGPNAWIIWPATLFAVPVIIGLLTAPPAPAANYTGTPRSVVVTVSRSDGECVNAWIPVDGVLTGAQSCDYTGIHLSYIAKSGDRIGADPVEVDGVSTTCAVWVDGYAQIVQTGFANINCLAWLA